VFSEAEQREQFTVVLPSMAQRVAMLEQVLHEYDGRPEIAEIIVVMNSLNESHVSSRLGVARTPISFVNNSINSLNARYGTSTHASCWLSCRVAHMHRRHHQVHHCRPSEDGSGAGQRRRPLPQPPQCRISLSGAHGPPIHSHYHTHSHIFIDGWVLRRCAGMAQVWQIHRRSIVGRTLRTSGDGVYEMNQPCPNIVLTNAAFVPTELMRTYAELTEGPIAQLRALIENCTNCEDIGINFVAAATGMDPPVNVHSGPVEISHSLVHTTSPPTAPRKPCN
jgi:hypothetical protein